MDDETETDQAQNQTTSSVYVVAPLDEATSIISFRWRKTKKTTHAPASEVDSWFHTLCDPFGTVEFIDSKEITKGCVYVGFDSIEAAKAARLEMDAKSCEVLGGRHIHVCFVKLTSAESRDAMRAGLSNVSSANPSLPDGLHFAENFLSEHEEQLLLEEIYSAADSGVEWEPDLARRVKHFGKKFNYVTRQADDETTSVYPPVLKSIVDRIIEHNLLRGPADQVTINEYKAGQGISSHIDTHSAFLDSIAVVSLRAPIILDFVDGLETKPNVSVVVPARSVYVMADESRHRWFHGIARRKRDMIDNRLENRETRLSLTVRSLRPASQPCACLYPSLCDSQLGTPSHILDNIRSPVLRQQIQQHQQQIEQQKQIQQQLQQQAANSTAHSSSDSVTNTHVGAGDDGNTLMTPQVELIHVQQLYSSIALHFSRTRHTGWPQVVSFVESLPIGSVVVDVGCGNGRYMSPVGSKPHLTFGSDICAEFVDICVNQRGFEACVADALQLPWRSASADVVLCIAVLHHISTESRRLALLSELMRIVKVGGHILMEAWAFEQDESSRRRFDAQDVMVPWKLVMDDTEDNNNTKTATITNTNTTDDNTNTNESKSTSDQAKNFNKTDKSNIQKKKKKQTTTIELQRYCHVFVQGEVPALFGKIKGAIVEKEWNERSNWCVLVQRVE